jgi:hypothetical protein
MDPGADRVAPGIGEADAGGEPVPGPHGLLDHGGIHVNEPELGAAEQPQRPVAGYIAPDQAQVPVVAGAPDERPGEVNAVRIGSCRTAPRARCDGRIRLARGGR